MRLNDEQEMIVESLRDLATSEFADRAFSWEGEFPWENYELLAEHGFLGMNHPIEYGGGGLTEFEAALAVETVGRICPDTALALYSQSMVGPRALAMFGSEYVKETYLSAVCAGEGTIGIAISEPGAGSDVAAMNTHLEEHDGEFRLSGEKVWISNVAESNAFVVWTKFPDGNLGTVVLDADAPGLEINNTSTNMAGQDQTHFFMNEIPIPEEHVMVQGPAAFKQQLIALNWERCGSSIFANALAECALSKAIEYATEREQFGQPIAEFQGIRWDVAEMVTELNASRALAYDAIRSAVQGDGTPDRLKATLAKLYSAGMVEEVVSDSLQLFGSTGYQQGHPLEYLYRLQRARRIAAGTDEIMKNNIADVIFKQGLPDPHS